MSATILFLTDLRRDRSETFAAPRDDEELSLERPTGFSGVVFSPDSKWIARLASPVDVNFLDVWDIKQDERLVRLPIPHEKVGEALAFSPDGRILATGGGDELIQLWSTETWKVLGQPIDWKPSVVNFLSDGKVLAAGNYGGKVALWDVATGRLRAKVVTLEDNSVHDLAVSSDDRLLVAVGGREIKVVDITTSRELWSFSAHVDPITRRVGTKAVVFLRDSKTFVTCGVDGIVRFWNLTAKQEKKTIAPKIGELESMALSPDQKLLAVAGWEAEDREIDDKYAVKLWNLETDKEIAKLDFKGVRVCGVRFSPDGIWLATASFGKNGQVKLWRVKELIEKGKE